jgi:RNA polymerase sigma-70 factor (family 1)
VYAGRWQPAFKTVLKKNGNNKNERDNTLRTTALLPITKVNSKPFPLDGDFYLILHQLVAGSLMGKFKSEYGFSEKEFENFFRQYYKLALYISVRITNDLVSSEDLVQDVFFDLWKNSEVNPLDPNLKFYLLRSIKNRSLNYNRDKKDHQEFKLYLHEYVGEEYNFEREERISKILLEIDKLPPKCQEIFKMVVFKGMKYSDVSEKLQITNNTVKTQLTIAYKQLKKFCLIFF